MSDKVCPSCGHCKECGRGGIQFRPYPFYPQPYWYGGFTYTGLATSGGTVPVTAAGASGTNDWSQYIQGTLTSSK